jgi:hypothetical protein
MSGVAGAVSARGATLRQQWLSRFLIGTGTVRWRLRACISIVRQAVALPHGAMGASSLPHGAFMSRYRRTHSELVKPRALKRLRQREAMLPLRREPLYFPEPEPPLWKPLG